ncbi:unnamed protein product [Miscanthus lutarioriparius]|uniref:BPL/LPL catalytic domain-containing protein n=1 Tax=Miscanthus lutarioriparius TaxID=422564 RepID=A0A811R5S0_9POAL|nr:unnamed protein product [Miscanthus lutarioriparius]
MASAGLAGVSGAACPLMRLVTMSSVPILQQLHLEEQLLRCTPETGASSMTARPLLPLSWDFVRKDDSIVHQPPCRLANLVLCDGRRVSELVEIQPVLRDQVPVVRRFSGGGTVIVDQGTVFVTFICNKNAVTGLQPFPRDIMSWSGQLYGKVFDRFGEFHLRENGNQARNHTDFLCRMKEYIPSRSVFTDGVIAALGEHFSVQPMDLQAILSSHEEFVPSTKLVSQQDLEEIVSSKESFRV